MNETLFTSLKHAREALAIWMEDYNTVRPRSAAAPVRVLSVPRKLSEERHCGGFRQAIQIVSETYPLAPLARALSAAANGTRDEAHKAFEALVAIRPAWRDDARGELRRIFPVRAVAERLADDLVKAGLTSG